VRLSDWQASFFEERVRKPASGADGVYFREQVFGALEVLSGALPDLEATLGEQNFRFFVRELLVTVQPSDAMGTSLILPFLEFLKKRPELAEIGPVQALVDEAMSRFL
jgi:hypothetical protein